MRFIILFTFNLIGLIHSILYPFETETRELKSLDGLWWFKAEEWNSDGVGFSKKWYNIQFSKLRNTTKLPVPASFNDLTQSIKLRDMLGWVWYQRDFIMPKSWKDDVTNLRFDGVNYFAAVFVNGVNVGNHTGGHLPFQFDVSRSVKFGESNTITVAVNNTLSHSTLPPGEVVFKSGHGLPENYVEHKPDFDFFNYAGINRHVRLYRTPKLMITDISTNSRIVTDTGGKINGLIDYQISTNNEANNHLIKVVLKEEPSSLIKSSNVGRIGVMSVSAPRLWWPRGSGRLPNLYTLEVTLYEQENGHVMVHDVYRMSIGIREIRLVENKFLINNETFYFKGFGMHEDADIRGRGYDASIMIKDLNLLEWMGGNSFRTSHYPYSEERMFECDRRGIVVIDETPVVGAQFFNSKNLALHKSMLTDLINRDRNHPSVVMWSIANEPQTYQNASYDYFKKLVALAKALDNSRPVDIVYGPSDYYNEMTASLVDVMCINRYYGWYGDIGRLDVAGSLLQFNLDAWYKKFNKPIIVTEYGAGSVAGINQDPPVDFSEAYQASFMAQYHKIFNELRKQYLIGEMVWNFADFMTAPAVNRVVGNRKGVLTRNRQPKLAAYLLKDRYDNLDTTSGCRATKFNYINQYFQ